MVPTSKVLAFPHSTLVTIDVRDLVPGTTVGLEYSYHYENEFIIAFDRRRKFSTMSQMKQYSYGIIVPASTQCSYALSCSLS